MTTSTASPENDLLFIAFGPQPIRTVVSATKLCGHNAVACGASAARLGATVVMGSRGSIDRLLCQLSPQDGAKKLQKAPQNNVAGNASPLSENGVRWLACGERGNSSNTMFTHLTGIYIFDPDQYSAPFDPSDWRRCQLLIESVPEVSERFTDMAILSEEWRQLVLAWPLILKAMNEEAPQWRDQRTSYKALESLKLIRTAVGRGHLNS